MREGTPQIASLKRTLATLEALITDSDGKGVAAVARELGMPVATIHRQIATLMAEGYLARLGNGRYGAGARLLRLLQHVDEKLVIANAAAPFLHRLAGEVGSVVQLGTLENDMVTYRIKTGQGAGDLFTQVGMQLEAYCSGIGKVLLAHLPEAERRSYLAGGPFVPLTSRTIVDPARLLEELDRVRAQGYAVDDGEIAEGLTCMAVPIRKPDGNVMAAISVSQVRQSKDVLGGEQLLRLLFETARNIEALAVR